ncbi:metallophosphoesterase at3g03305-like protein [Trifolium pratense]|uniref:Metallophosphoesterase at3g03305-like protein n=1 Tax=Trifolium pratense TaxID=57577 RepID=A0A2K3L8T5_TRIPR|nr:metallophosphoesterase at3g03305-like protein [Trifolium pratense]
MMNLFVFTIVIACGIYCCNGERLIDVKGNPDSVIWVVQLSDLHFSVHHPNRAQHFNDLVAPSLSIINPSLVLITGDLTDGKSKDLLTMKQNEDEWVEYRNVMDNVIERSGLQKSLFYDLRGNHDSFGVPVIGGSFDFFSKYSINGQLGRNGSVSSVTLEVSLNLNPSFTVLTSSHSMKFVIYVTFP